MAAFDLVSGRKSAPLDEAALAMRLSQASSVLIDFGTGEGKSVLDAARVDSTRLCIGIDAAVDNLADAARKAGASAKKGGLPNALFIRGAAERLPGPFVGVADSLTVQYPWGSLMRIVAEPAVGLLRGLRSVCKVGADLSVLLNHSVFGDRDYLARLGMGDLQDPTENPELAAGYAAAGFRLTHQELFHGDPPVRTAWGRHLVRGSGRVTLLIEAVAD